MTPPRSIRWAGNQAIVDQRSGLTTILMMVVSVEAVIVAATLANHHWGWTLSLLPVFLLLDLWIGCKAYGLGIGLRGQELEAGPSLPPALREAAHRQLEQLQSQTDRDWLTRAELRRLRRNLA